MNKDCFRVIFSRAHGKPVVVAEHVSGKAGGGRSGAPAGAYAAKPFHGIALRLLALSLRFASGTLFLLSLPVQAGIVADAAAPQGQQPTVLNTANGLPQVNIQTPSAAGVSRNTYSQFDVDGGGAILNNSRTDVQTRLGGWVTANPWLARGPARIILNEVNASNPSLLQGYIEVAGARAQVVIANPAGISCNGCGFINADRATLTTGTPVFNNGSLEAYRVQRGTVFIDGAGMDATETDYTDVIARAVQVNAGIWAKQLNVLTGPAEHAVPVTGAPVTLSLATAQGAAPAYAVDVSALGGMYAGQILLLGTEAGLGVHNAGVLGASAGELTLGVDGQLENTGRLSAAGDMSLTARDGVLNAGTVYAQHDLSVATAGNIQNSQMLAAGHDVTLMAVGRSGHVDSTTTSIIAAGMGSDGQLSGTGSLNAVATEGIGLHGQNMAAGNVVLQSATLDLSSSQNQAQNLSMQASGDLVLSAATLSATGKITLAAGLALHTEAATVSATQLDLSAHDLINTGGKLIQTGTDDLSLFLPGQFDNSRGTFASNSQNLSVSADTLNNTGGQVIHAGRGGFRISVANLLDNTQGTINSNALNLALSARLLNNTAGDITHAGGGQLGLTVADTLAGSQGILASAGQLTLNATTVTLDGATTTAKQIEITADRLLQPNATLKSGGLLTLMVREMFDNTEATATGDGAVTVATGTLLNTGGTLTAGQGLNVSATQALDNVGGVMAANADLVITAAGINNTQGTMGSATRAATITSRRDAFTNAMGQLQAATTLNLEAQGLDNTGGLISGSAVMLNTGLAKGAGAFNLDNSNGKIVADAVGISSGAINNAAGLISSNSHITINTQGQTLSNTLSGTDKGILAQGDISLLTGDWINTGGFVGAGGQLAAISAQISNEAGGLIQSRGPLTLNATGVNNQGGILQTADSLTVQTGAGLIDNSARGSTGSLMQAGRDLILSAGTVLNAQTTAEAQGLQADRLILNADTVTNTQGTLRAQRALAITGHGVVDNSQGLVSSQGNLTIQDSIQGSSTTSPAQSVLNTGGTLIADSTITIQSDSLSGDGQILSRGDIAIGLQKDYVHTGLLQALGRAQLSTAGTIRNNARLLAGDILTLSATQIDNAATGEINANTNHLIASDSLTNRGLIDGGNVRLEVGNTLTNLGSGRIYGDHLSIQAGSLLNTDESVNGVTTAAVIAARSRLDIGVSGTLTNEHHALMFSGGDMAIGGALDVDGFVTGQAGTVNNVGSTIEALGALEISAGTLNNRNANFQTQDVLISSSTKMYVNPGIPGTVPNYLLDASVVRPQHQMDGVVRVWNQDFSQVPANPVLGLTKIPVRGQPINCGQANCPIADYGPNDPAWSYFEVQPPVAAPAPPALSASDPGYADAMAAYNAAYLAWQTASASAYSQLDTHIGRYNSFLGSEVTPEDGAFIVNWTDYSITRTVTQTQVTTSEPGSIRSGGNATFKGGVFTNDKSLIVVGGLLTGQMQALNNIDGEGTETSTDTGWSQYYHMEAHNGDWYPDADPHLAYNDSAVKTIKLPVTNSPSSGSGLVLGPIVLPGAPGMAAGISTVSLGLTASAKPGVIQEVPLSGVLKPGQTVPVVRTVLPNLSVPNNALFHTNPDANSHVLIETDPRFANYRQWLSSDYLLQALNVDAALTQKRLGDGFYEQKLIREQVAELTGHRFIEGYASEEEEYRGLMDNAVTFARAYGLRPGIALTAEQMAALTSDIVWLVEQTVTLPDGSTQQVLVPQLYVRARAGDLDGDGSLIAAEDMNLTLKGDFSNSGTVAGRNVMKLTAENIKNLGGRLDAGDLTLAARHDLTNLGGLITAKDNASVTAGHNLTMATTTFTIAHNSADPNDGMNGSSRTGIDRVAGLYVSNPGGTLTLSAGNDLTLTSAQVANTGSGGTTIHAGHNLTLDAVTVARQNNAAADGQHYLKDGSTTEVGTVITTGVGGLDMSADHNLTARATTAATAGALTVTAGNDLTIESGHATQNHADATTTGHGYQNQSRSSTDVMGSTFSGASVGLTATQGTLTVKGSAVSAKTGNVNLTAGKGIDLLADDEAGSQAQSHASSSGHGKKVTRDESSQSLTQVGTRITAAGNATLAAQGGDLTLAASNVKAGGNITAKAAGDINVLSGVNSQSYSLETTKKGQTKYSNHQEGYVKETLAQAGFEAGGDLKLDGQGDVNLAAAQLKSGGTLQIGEVTIKKDAEGNVLHDEKGRLVVDRGTLGNVNDSAVELTNKEWNATQKGYTGPVKSLINAGTLVVASLAAPATAGQLKLPTVKTGESSQQKTESQTTVSSTLQGQNILLSARNDVNLQGTALSADNKIAILGKNVNLGVASSTSTVATGSGKETTQGLGTSFSTGEVQLYGEEQKKAEHTVTTTMTTHQGVTVRAHDITVMADNAVDMTAATLAADAKDGKLTVDAKTITIGGVQDTTMMATTDKTETTTLAMAARNAYVDTALAAKALKDGVETLGKATKDLADARRRVEGGSLSQDALKDYVINFEMAQANVASLEIAFAASAATGAATTETGGMYVSGSAKKDSTSSTSTVTQGNWQGSNLSGHDVSLNADESLLITGSTVSGDIGEVNAKHITLKTGQNTYTQGTSSSTKSVGMTVSVAGGGSVGVNASTGHSESDDQGIENVNSHLTFGQLKSKSETLTLAGAVMEADTAKIDTKTLTINTLQDTSSSHNRSSHYGVGVSAGGSGGMNGNVSVGNGNGHSNSATTGEQSAIIVHDGATSQITAEDTVLDGGLIANAMRDATGKLVDQGNLNLTTNTLTFKNVGNKSESDQQGFNIGLSSSSAPGQASHPGAVSLGATHSGHLTESQTLATLGQGQIVVKSDAVTGKDSLAGLNRDVGQTMLITQDQDTAALNANLTVDTRLFTEAGREQIAGEQKSLGKNVQVMGKSTGSGVHNVAEIGASAFAAPENAKALAAKIEDAVGALGIVPTALNHGGLILGETPILLGASDIDQRQMVAARPDSPYAQSHPELGWVPVSETAGYALLSPEQQATMGNLMVSTAPLTIDATTSTYQNATNGMLNTESLAVYNAVTQTHDLVTDPSQNVLVTLNYNPTRGVLADGIESGFDKLATQTGNSLFSTSVARETGDFQNEVMLARGSEGANFANHSQGNLLSYSGLIAVGVDPNIIFGDDPNKRNFSFSMYGSPVNAKNFDAYLKLHKIQLVTSSVNNDDFVGQVLGGNYGLYVAGQEGKTFVRVESASPTGGMAYQLTTAIPLEQTSNPVNGNSSFTDLFRLFGTSSTHSNYGCVSKCGAYNPVLNTTPINSGNK